MPLLLISVEHNVSASRGREVGEIIPTRAEHSRSDDDVASNCGGAGNAIDMNLETRSCSKPDSDGKTWLKLTLDQIHCVKEVIRYKSDGDKTQTWTCPESACNCEGEHCSRYTMAVRTEGQTKTDLSPVSDCSYGDTLMHEQISVNTLRLAEIAVIGMRGKSFRV